MTSGDDAKERVINTLALLGLATTDAQQRHVREQLDVHPDPAQSWERVRETLGRLSQQDHAA